MTKPSLPLNPDKSCRICPHFLKVTDEKKLIDTDESILFFYLGVCDCTDSDHYGHTLMDLHPSCSLSRQKQLKLTSTGNRGVEEDRSTTNPEDWLKETIDMLLRTRMDPRKEENEHSVSEWAKSPLTKKALKAHGVTYDELMNAYRKRRDEVNKKEGL